MLQRRPPTGDSVRSRSISPRSSGQPSLGFSPRRKSRVLDSQRLTKRRQDLLALELAQRTEILAFFDVERVRMADLYVKGISASKEATIVRLEQDVDTLRTESDRNLKGYRNDLTTIAKGLSSLLQDCLALGIGGDHDDPERQALEATLKRLQTGSSSASAGKGSGVGSTPGQHDISLLFHGGVDAAITNSYEIGSAASFATSSHSPKRIGSASTSRQANKPSVPQNTNPAISIPSLRRASSSSTSASVSLRHHGGTVAHTESPYRSMADGTNPSPPIITAKILQDDISSLSQVLQQLLHSAASRLRYSATRLTYMETLLDQQQSQLVATDRMLNGYLVRAPTDIDRSIDMVRHMGAEVTAKLAAIESKALTMVDKLLTDSAPLEYLRIQAAKAIREGSNGSLAHSMLASEQQSLKAKFKEEVRLLTEDQAELLNFVRGELLLLTKKRLEVAAGKGDLPSVGDNTPLTLLSLPGSVRHNEAVPTLPRLHLIEDQTTSLPVALRVARLNVDASPMGNSSRISLGHTPHPEESSTVVLSPATAQPSPVGSPKQRRIQPVMVLDSNNSSDNTAIYSGTNGFALSATVPLAADKSAQGEMPAFEAPRTSTQTNVANQYNPWLASHAHVRGGPSHYLHRSNLPPSLRSRLEADVATFDRTELLRIIDLVSHEPRVAEAITAVMDEYFRWEEGAKQKLQVMEAIGRATAPPPEPTPELSIVETRPRAPTDPPSTASKSGPLVISGGRSLALAGPSSGLEFGGADPSQEVVASDPRHEVALNAQRRLYKTFDSLNMGSAIATVKAEAVEGILEKQSATTRNPSEELTYGARITDILNEPPAGGDTASGPVLSDRYKRYAQRATPEATDYSHNNLYTREFQSKVLEELYTDTRNRLLEEEGARLEGTDLGTKALNAASAAAAGVNMGVASSHSRPYVPTPIVSKNAVIDPVTAADQPRKALLLASPAGRKWYESSRLHQQGLQDLKAAIASGAKLDGAPQGFDHLPALTDPRGAGREGDSFFYRNPATQTPWTDEEVMRLVKRDEDASRRRRISEATLTNTSMLSNSPATSLFKGPMTASNTSFPSAISSQPPLSHTTSAAIAYQSLLSNPPDTLSPPQEPLRSRFDTDNPLAFVPLPPRDPSAESKRVSAQQRKLAAAFGP